jgi:hypothetical protein
MPEVFENSDFTGDKEMLCRHETHRDPHNGTRCDLSHDRALVTLIPFSSHSGEATRRPSSRLQMTTPFSLRPHGPGREYAIGDGFRER